MYGDLDAYAENQSPTVKNLIEINKTLTSQLDEMRAHTMVSNEIKGEAKKTSDKLSNMDSNMSDAYP